MGDDQHGAVGAAQRIHALGDDAHGIDVEAGIGLVEHAERRLEQRHLQDLVPLLLAAGEADIERALQHLGVDLEQLRLLAHQPQEIGRRQLRLPARLAHRVHRRAQEGHGGDARNLHRVLEGEEHAGGGALGRVHGEQVLTLPGDRARGDLVIVLAGQHISERRLAGAVRPHDGVHLARGQREVEAFEDLAAIDIDVKVLDLKHYDSSLILWH